MKSFFQSTFNPDFNKFIVQVGVTISVIYGCAALASRLGR